MMTKTCKDINASLALDKGWRRETAEETKEQGWINPQHMRGWFDPDGAWRHRPPDFCGDWKHAGPLQVEIYKRYGWVKTSDLIERQLASLCGEHVLDPMV